MQETIKEILLINIYWLSLPFIGFAVIYLLSSQSKEFFGLRKISSHILKQHFFIIFLYSFTTIFFIITVASIVLYILHAPAKLFTLLYIVSVLIAVAYLFFQFSRKLFSTTAIDLLKLNKVDLFTKIVLLLMMSIVLGDYFLSLYIKSFFAGDAVFHLSRVVDILASGFNINSPHHSNLPEAAYHYNSVYSLYIPPAQIFDIPPYKVWEYSLSFFRLLQWTAIYALAAHVVKHFLGVKKHITLLASALTIMGISISVGYLFIANYPSRLVDVWVMLLLTAISIYESKVIIYKFIILMLAIIIACTHPTYSLMIFLFFILFIIIKTVLYRKLLIKENVIYILSLLILAITPTISFLTPGKLSDAQQSIFNPNTLAIVNQVIRKPFVHESGISIIIVILLGLSFIGYLYLLMKMHRQKSQLALIASLMLFFPLIAYVPFVYGVISKILPPWMIERFSQMNVLMPIVAGIGVYAVTKLLIRLINNNELNKYLYVFSCILIIVLSAFIARSSYLYLLVRGGWNQTGYEITDINYEQIKNVYKNGDTILSNPERSFTIPELLAVDVVAVEIGHSTKSADTENRLLCQQNVLKSLKYQDLVFLGVDYVELPINTDTKVLAETDYLKKIGVVQDHSIYKFTKERATLIDNEKVTKSCVEFVENEKGLHLFNQ